MGITPQEYEQKGEQSAREGNYAIAAQNYALAAQGYGSVGNFSAAAVNHERAASFYAAIGSSELYLDQSIKAAESYALAGSAFLDEKNYWYAANAYQRSAAFYNVTDRPSQYREMQLKAGNAFLEAARSADNLTARVERLYWAVRSFHRLDEADFQRALGELSSSVDRLKEEATAKGNESVFDVLDLYYLPVFTQIIADDVLSANEMTKVADLATVMGLHSYAGTYLVSAAILYSDSGLTENAEFSLASAGRSYARAVARQETWGYEDYLAGKDDLEMSLYILNHLGLSAEVAELAELATDKLSRLRATLESAGDAHSAAGLHREAAANYSDAGEISYVLGNEVEFKRLNELSGSQNYMAAQLLEKAGNESGAAALYEEAGLLLQLGGSQTYKAAYAAAAALHAKAGNQFLALGNLTTAALNLRKAAEDYKAAGSHDAAYAYYQKYIGVLGELMTAYPSDKGFLLVSIGDAQASMGEISASADSYALASDELVSLFSFYWSYYPQYILSAPELSKSLVKSYRLSGRLFLARHLVATLDYPSFYSTLATLASFAQNYATASRIHRSLAASDLDVYDFQSYAVNQLFAAIAAMMAGDTVKPVSSLEAFEVVSHPLHSSNRKFHELLTHSLKWVNEGDRSELDLARAILSEIQSVTGDSDVSFLLEDLAVFLSVETGASELPKKASEQASRGEWTEVGRGYWVYALLKYFQEEFSISRDAFEDSSFSFLKSGDYASARKAADRAGECLTEPTEYIIGLQLLSKAFIDGNRTLAGMAKASFKQSLKSDYKSDRSRELAQMAGKLRGTEWASVALQGVLLGTAFLTALIAFLFIKRRSEHP